MRDFFEEQEIAQASAQCIDEHILSLGRGDFCQTRVVGYSVCGRPLRVIEIGGMQSPALFVGGTHGMEWLSVFVCLKLAQEILSAAYAGKSVYGIDYAEALRSNGVAILPLLNPDGYELFRTGTEAAPSRWRFLERMDPTDLHRWQANARGVDLNRNFNAGFYKAKRMVDAVGIRRPAPSRYGGLVPFSEPESRAVRRLCAQLRPRTLFALHSQGEEIYWRYGEKIPFGAQYIADLLSSLSGYTLAAPEVIASHAGLKDWFIKKYNRPGFTIELGLGRNPLPCNCFAQVWEQVKRAMFVATVV